MLMFFFGMGAACLLFLFLAVAYQMGVNSTRKEHDIPYTPRTKVLTPATPTTLFTNFDFKEDNNASGIRNHHDIGRDRRQGDV